ncbi:MAG: hypothetical protein VXZ39_12955 [Planctomycetota bacterium]|nr:hypothetical protein [Planctomycetota bacterium]MEC8511807.1 hypothetical protein [Planctomycetota bacterium]
MRAIHEEFNVRETLLDFAVGATKARMAAIRHGNEFDRVQPVVASHTARAFDIGQPGH